jgi:arylformamidase
MDEIIDISVPLKKEMPVWPGSSAPRLIRIKSLEDGDACTASRLECDVHSGTHIDAPMHFMEKGNGAEALPLNGLIGPAYVADLGETPFVNAASLDRLGLPRGIERLLLRTQNSQLWASGVREFTPDYVALTPDAAQWVVDQGTRLIGIDYLSVQRFQDGPLTHQIMLNAEVIIVEGLNLTGVSAGMYELICLPICLVGAEGAPARAVLRPVQPALDQLERTRE